jgi:simple sugar transport system substrate-binding protein
MTNTGTEVLGASAQLKTDDIELEKMDYFVEGVIGSIPMTLS